MKLRIVFFLFACSLFNASVLSAKPVAAHDSVPASRFTRTSDAFYKVLDNIIEVDGEDEEFKRFRIEDYSDILTVFKWKPNRDVVFVCFEANPSEQDFLEAKENILEAQAYFRNYGLDTLENIKRKLNPRTGLMYEQQEYTLATIPEQYKDFAFGKSAKKGAYTELKQVGDTYTMARIIRCNYSTPDSVKLKISVVGNTSIPAQEQWVRVDELLNDYIKNRIRKTPFGGRFVLTHAGHEIAYQVDSLTKPTRKVELAELKVEVRPSSITYRATYDLAKRFSDYCNNEEDVYFAAQSEGLTIRPLADLLNALPRLKTNMSIVVPNGFDDICQIIRWAYIAENVGAVSKVYEYGRYYIIAIVVDVTKSKLIEGYEKSR